MSAKDLVEETEELQNDLFQNLSLFVDKTDLVED